MTARGTGAAHSGSPAPRVDRLAEAGYPPVFGPPDRTRLESLAAWRSQLSDRIGIAVVGTGDWGANLVRNYANLPGARLVAMLMQ